MTHPLSIAAVSEEERLAAERLTAAQVRRGLAKLRELGVTSGPTWELVVQRAVTLGVGDSSLVDRRGQVKDGPAQNDTAKRRVWIEMPLQGGYVYWALQERPLAVTPKVSQVRGKNCVDTTRWQVVYIYGDEAEPLTEPLLTLAGAKRLAEALDGDSLIELQESLRAAIRTTRPADFADYAPRLQDRSRWADGRFRSQGVGG